MKVLFIEPPPEHRVGGIETALAGLKRALAPLGVDVLRTSKPTKSGIRTADVVHFHGIWELRQLRARMWCRSQGRPFILSPHGMLEEWAFRHRGWKKRPYFNLVARPSISRAAILLATSDAEATRLTRWFPAASIRVLPLGSDPAPDIDRARERQKLGLEPDDYVILFLSRCHEKKGLHLLIRAMPVLVNTKTRRTRLFIVGEGEDSYVAPLREAASNWRGSPECTWVGAIWGPERWTYLAAADLFCLPSYSENFGVAILESLLAGTPALTTTETPWNSLRGSLPVFLTRPEMPSLASALDERIAAGPLSQAGRDATRREATNRFSWSAIAQHYLELYKSIACSGWPTSGRMRSN